MQTQEFKNINSNQVPSNSSVEITLTFPITTDGMLIERLFMRRPLVRDRLAVEKSNGSEIEKEIRFISNLCEMAPQHIELLDLADYTQLQECLASFLS